MVKYIQNQQHYKEVLSKAVSVKESLWIGTADIKDLYVGSEPFLSVLAELLKRGCLSLGKNLTGAGIGAKGASAISRRVS